MKSTAALPNENVREMLNRWTHWLGDAMDYDGFRLDAGKHVVREFYGGPGSGFLHEAQWSFDQRRGTTTSHEVAIGNPPSPSRRFYRILLHVP